MTVCGQLPSVYQTSVTFSIVWQRSEYFKVTGLQSEMHPQRSGIPSLGARNIGSMAAVFHDDGFAPTGGEVETEFLLKKPVNRTIPLTDDLIMQARELPAVATMATVIQPGDPNLMFVAFAAIGRWIEVNGYRMAGPYREIVLETPDLTRLDEMVVEVQLPVERDSSPFSLTAPMPV